MTSASELVVKANGLVNRLSLSEAEHCLQRAIALDPYCVDAMAALSRLLLLNQRTADAVLLLDRALALEADHAEVLALKGVCWMMQHRFDLAIDLLEQANHADPDLGMVYFNLGRCRRELGQLPSAEENLRKAIQKNPRHFEAYSELSAVQMLSGQVKDSIHSALRAIRIIPDDVQQNPHVLRLREWLCSLYALERDFSSAFREALEITNRRRLYTDYLRLGSYAVALQQFETAERAFQASIDLNPDSWEGHYNLGELYMSARWLDRAKEQYQTAVNKSRGSYEPFNGMGLFVLTVEQDSERAIDLLKQALEAAPSRVEPQLNLALAYAKKRELPAAQRFVASVLTLSKPGDPIYDQAERLQSTIRIESRTLASLR